MRQQMRQIKVLMLIVLSLFAGSSFGCLYLVAVGGIRRGPLAFAPAPIVGAAGRAAWAPGRDRRGAWARRDLW